MKKTTCFLFILCAFLLQSCGLLQGLLPEPDQFTLNREIRNGAFIDAENLTDIDSIEQKGDNALLMHSGATIGMASYFVTNFLGDFTVNVQQGEGIKFSFRTTSHDLKTNPGVSFTYTTSGSWVEENGRIIARFDTVKAISGQKERIQITNMSNKYSIQVGCTVIYNGTSNLPATEFIVASTVTGSRVLLTGIDFIPIRRADSRNTPEARAERCDGEFTTFILLSKKIYEINLTYWRLT